MTPNERFYEETPEHAFEPEPTDEEQEVEELPDDSLDRMYDGFFSTGEYGDFIF
jgi:hypothetical protein